MSLAIIFLTILSSRIHEAICRPRKILLPTCKTTINLASVDYLFQITAESLVKHLVGKIVSRESVWMASSPSCPCCDVHIFELIRLCAVYEVHICGVFPIYAPHSTTEITQWHTYNTQQNVTHHCCLTQIGRKYFSTGKLGVFIVKIWPFGRKYFVWPFVRIFGNLVQCAICPTFRN